MKRLALLIIFLCIFICCFSNNTDLQLLGLKGKVKTCTQKAYRGINNSGKWEKEDNSPLYTTVMHFNKDGYLTEYYLYSEMNNSKVINKRKSNDYYESLFYDEDDNITMIEKNKFISPEKLVSKYYDTKNNHMYTDTSYLKNGLIIKDYNAQDKAIISYKYKNNLLIEAFYNSEYAELIDKYEYLKFDRKNNWTLRIMQTEYKFFEEEEDEFLETEIVEQVLEYY